MPDDDKTTPLEGESESYVSPRVSPRPTLYLEQSHVDEVVWLGDIPDMLQAWHGTAADP
jgi:hypothetical protein